MDKINPALYNIVRNRAVMFFGKFKLNDLSLNILARALYSKVQTKSKESVINIDEIVPYLENKSVDTNKFEPVEHALSYLNALMIDANHVFFGYFKKKGCLDDNNGDINVVLSLEFFNYFMSVEKNTKKLTFFRRDFLFPVIFARKKTVLNLRYAKGLPQDFILTPFYQSYMKTKIAAANGQVFIAVKEVKPQPQLQLKLQPKSKPKSKPKWKPKWKPKPKAAWKAKAKQPQRLSA